MPEFSTEFWVGTALAVVALLAGLAVAIVMVESTKGEFRFVVFCFVISSAIVVYGIGVWEVSVTWPAKPRIIAATLAFAVVAMLTAEIIRWAYGRHIAHKNAVQSAEKKSEPEPPVPLPPAPDTALFMESEIAALPITIPQHSRLNVVPINKRRIKAANWGIFAVPNDTDRDQKWPDKHTMVTSSTTHNPGIWAWRCRLSNHGPTNLLSAAVSIRIWFGNEKPEMVHTVIASPLDSGKEFVFYMVNDCHEVVNAVWPDTATVQIFGETHPRSIPLRRTYKTPIDQIMMFFGSTTRFVGGEPCE
jgi:hypothetical protein